MLLKKKIRNKRGQATLEYILILVVGVVLVGGLLNQFAKPFAEFSKGYLFNEKTEDGYYTCLMQSAALPGTENQINCQKGKLGSGDSSWAGTQGGGGFSGSDSFGTGGNNLSVNGGGNTEGSRGRNTNNTPSDSHSQSPGHYPGGGNGGSNPWDSYSSAHSSSSNPYASSSSDLFKANSGNGSGAFGSGRSGLGDGALGAGGALSRAGNANQSALADNDLNNENNKKGGRKGRFKAKKKKGSTLSSASSGSGFGGDGLRNQAIFSAAQVTGPNREEEEFEGQSSFAVSSAEKKKGVQGEAKRASFVVEEKKIKKEAQDEDPSFTFGNFFKWLFIIALIVAILFFIGSQFMQVNENLKTV